MGEFVFEPSMQQAEYSNIDRFMKKHSIQTLEELRQKASGDLAWYWESVSKDVGVQWTQNYSKVYDTSRGVPWTDWFVGGKTNIISSSLDRFAQLEPEKTAYFFESEDGKKSSVTYGQLQKDVNRLANSLVSGGIKKGDVIAVYMPMIKEAIVAVLAAAKIGAVSTVVFSGYSREALKTRLDDCKARALFVSDGFLRKGKAISQKEAVDYVRREGLEVIVARYAGVDKYDDATYYDEFVSQSSDECATLVMDSSDPLFILYTSGTTGKPKGVVHVHGGFSVFAGHQAAYLIDLHSADVLFWPADMGWITGLVWNVYGMLMIGASAVIYDGAINWPDSDRLWKMCEQYNATIFGTSPTAARMLKKSNEDPSQLYDLSKLRNIPSTGEPIDEESWWWLFEKIGGKKIPIMNLSGGTEIGGAMLSVFPGMKLKPATVGVPCPGIDLDIFDDDGNSVKGSKGYLVVRQPWPGMTRGLLHDNERYIETYWSRFEGVWFHGDYVMCDDDGLWYMLGRTDDVINISGHRLSTAEIEQTVISHPDVSDAASVSIPDEIKGEAIVVFAVPQGAKDTDSLKEELAAHIARQIGKVALPKLIVILPDLPRTSTGKTLRRLLRAKLLGEDPGDLSSLENPSVLDDVPQIT